MKKQPYPQSSQSLVDTLNELSQRASEINPNDLVSGTKGGIKTQEGTHYHFTLDNKVFRWSVERFSDDSLSLCCTIGVPMTRATFEAIADEHTF